MDPLVSTVQEFARRYHLFTRGDTVIVGVSGGPDSLCLLHVLHQLSSPLGLQLRVAHLHHGLRGEDADADARFVAEVARTLGLPCIEGRADVKALASRDTRGGRSLEEAARIARYAFLSEVARDAGAGVIAVGHNADDQAETVLMHFLRGSGVSGLRGMASRSRLPGEEAEEAQGDAIRSLRLVRPLLQVGHDRIAAYCVAHQLAPRYDLSNADTTFFRNRLRHELIPILEAYNPAIREVMARTAEGMAGDAEIVRDRVEAVWDDVVLPSAPDEVRFDLDTWRDLPIGLQRATLREAVQRLRRTLRNIHWEHIERAVWLAREGRAGQSATLTAGLALDLGYDRLRIAAEDAPEIVATPQIAGALPLNAPGITHLPGGGRVVVEGMAAPPARPDLGADSWQAWLDADATGSDLSLRLRFAGDHFQPHGMGGHTMKLNEYMINAKIPREARHGWPLLIGRQGIAWVCGLRIDARAALTAATTRVWRVYFER